MHRVLIPGTDWRRLARHLARDGAAACLVGSTGVREDAGVREVLLRSLEPSAPERLGEALGRWSDILVARPLAGGDPSAAARIIIDEHGLDRARRATVLLAGVGAAAGRLAGVVREAGATTAVDECRVLGAGGPRWSAGLDASAPGNVPERWSRAAGAMTARVWALLRASRVAVVGCGRSGSVAAELLAREGVGGLVLVDPDRIEEGNLDATLGAGPADVGRPKVEVIAAALRVVHPDLDLVPLAVTAQSPASLRALRTADVIVTTVDGDAARLAVAHLASAYLRVHIDIGTGVFAAERGVRRGADVRFVVPGSGCVLCIGGLRDEAGARRELARRPDTLRPVTSRTWQDERAGSLATLNFTAVSLGVQLLLDFLAGHVTASRWVRFE